MGPCKAKQSKIKFKLAYDMTHLRIIEGNIRTVRITNKFYRRH